MAKVKGECWICIPLECGLKTFAFIELILGGLMLVLYSLVLSEAIDNEEFNNRGRAVMHENAVAHYGIEAEYMSLIVATFFFLMGIFLLYGIYGSSNLALKIVWIAKIIFALFCMVNVIINIVAYFRGEKSMVYTTIGHFCFMGYFAFRVREYDKKLEALKIRASPC